MYKSIRGDIFKANVDAIVNPVNTDGVMGAGLALLFRRKYPDMFKYYNMMCEAKAFEVGDLMWWDIRQFGGRHKYIINFPTKVEWSNPSKLIYIIKGLYQFRETYDKYGITSIGFPRLGCGFGGLLWKGVEPIMMEYLQPLPIDCFVYSIGQSDG